MTGREITGGECILGNNSGVKRFCLDKALSSGVLYIPYCNHLFIFIKQLFAPNLQKGNSVFHKDIDSGKLSKEKRPLYVTYIIILLLSCTVSTVKNLT